VQLPSRRPRMPEGPECHAIGEKLAAWIGGRTILSLTVVAGRYRETGVPGEALLRAAAVAGRTEVGHVRTHGKMIYIALPSAKLAIVSTLGLSGTWSNRRTAHCDVRMETSGGKVWFKDQLHYGTMAVVPKSVLDKRLIRLGPDVTMGGAITKAWWREFAVRKGEKSVAEVLMNQAWIAGVGNYLKAEIMYAAGVAPLSRLDDLPKAVLDKLLHCINTLPRAWYDGKVGAGPRQRVKVYGRKTDPAGRVVVRTKTPDARITHWVPGAQVEYTAH